MSFVVFVIGLAPVFFGAMMGPGALLFQDTAGALVMATITTLSTGGVPFAW